MAKKSRKRLPNLGIEYLFGSVALLRILSDFKRNLALYKANYDAHRSLEVAPDLLEGFKFAIIAILHRIIIDCIESPELVGVRRDANISQAYLWGKAEARLLRKLSGRSSHGILIGNSR